MSVHDDTTMRYGDQPALRGRSCVSCGLVVYPAMGALCTNCWSIDLSDTPIGQSGKIHSHTIVHRSTRSEIVPFIIGLIDLPEGPRVMARIDVTDGESLCAGDDVRIQDAPDEPHGFLYRPTGRPIVAATQS